MSKDFEEKIKVNFERNSKYLRELLEENKIKLNFEHDVHLKYLSENNKEKFIEEFIQNYSFELRLMNEERLEQFKRGEEVLIGSNYFCNECGKRIFYNLSYKEITPMEYVKTTGIDTEIKSMTCNKIPSEYSMDIAFPTGELICDDGLPYRRDIFKDISNKDYNINASKGIYDTIIDYAKENVLHIFVGNTCPSVWLKDNDKLAIGNSYEDGECTCGSIDYKSCTCESKEINPLDGKDISFICTDLWWASVVDVSIYKKLLIDTFGEEKGLTKLSEIKKIKTRIKPGIYRCTYYKDSPNYDTWEEGKPTIYCKMNWIKEI